MSGAWQRQKVPVPIYKRLAEGIAALPEALNLRGSKKLYLPFSKERQSVHCSMLGLASCVPTVIVSKEHILSFFLWNLHWSTVHLIV